MIDDDGRLTEINILSQQHLGTGRDNEIYQCHEKLKSINDVGIKTIIATSRHLLDVSY